MFILGKHCPTHKGISLALTSVFGINRDAAYKICAAIGVRGTLPLGTLKGRRLDLLRKVCRDRITMNDRRAKDAVKHLIDAKHYRGVRHMFGLPARGQRTRTNASTAKRCAVIKQLSPQKAGHGKGKNKPMAGKNKPMAGKKQKR